jgi:hypothetical protein
VGTDSATGEYVMYVDQDDRLEPEALQRMYDLGANNEADVVLGKVTSDFRGVHQYLYREQRPHCSIYDSRLINSQTPHKMLRRRFLLEHGIRYPEGRRRLEDQLFITKAYFAASSTSIVADYVCYRYLRRSDDGNAGDRQIDPPSYFENLRDVLDVIDAHTESGPVRDRFYRRFLRVEMLGKLSGQKVMKTSAARGDLWLLPIRQLAQERFPTSVDDGLPTTARLRAHLMRHGTFSELKGLTDRTRTVQPKCLLDSLHASDGAARLRIAGGFADHGSALALDADGSGGWLLPESITGPDVAADLRRVDDPSDMSADLVVVSRELGDEWFIDRPLSVWVEPDGSRGALRMGGDVAFDPRTAAGGAPLTTGRHDLAVRVDALGLSRLRPLRAAEADGFRAVLTLRPRTVLMTSARGRVSLDVGVSGRVVRKRLGPVVAVWDGNRLAATLSAGWLATPELKAVLTSAHGRKVTVRLAPGDARATIWRSQPGALDPGRYQTRLLLPGCGAIDLDGAVVIPRSPKLVARAVARRAAHAARRLWRHVRVAGRTTCSDQRT